MKRTTQTLLAASALATLVACGGGGGDRDTDGPSDGPSASVALAGTAATGAPMAGACIRLVDRLGATRDAVANAEGRYRIENLEDLALPAMVRAGDCSVGGPLPTLYSALDSRPAEGDVVLNVTPVTSAVLMLALSSDLGDAFASRSFANRLFDGDRLDAARQRMSAVLGEVLQALGLPAGTDLLGTAFAADGTGLDKLLDLVGFDILYDDSAAIDDYVVRVSNKGSGAIVTVTAPDTGPAPAPLPAPAADVLALDLAGIAQLVSGFNQLRATAAGLTSAQMAQLFHPEFLHDGADAQALLDEFAEEAAAGELGGRIVHHQIQACDGASRTCDLLVNDRTGDGDEEQFSLQVVFDTERGQWLFLGNQRPFEFDLKPVINFSATASGGQFVTSSLSSGVNLYIPLDSGYQSARLSVSSDGGASWQTALDLKAKPDQCPQADHLVVDSGPTLNCGNYVAIGNTQAQATNSVIDQGLRRFRIEVFDDEDWTQSAGTFSGVTRQRLFTQATAQIAFQASGLGIDPDGLGTDLLAFQGSGIRSVSARFVTGASATGNTTWSGRHLGVLGGYVTTPAAYALCLGNSSPEACGTVYGSAAVIDRVFLSARVPGGHGAIWANYSRAAAQVP